MKKCFPCPSCRREVYGPKDVPLERWADSYPSNHMIRTLLDNFKMEDSDNMCDEHNGKELEFFCSDHERTICSMCVVLKHRQCNDVSTIEAAAEKTKQKSSELEEKLQLLNKWMEKKKSKRQQVQLRLREAETSISSWRKVIEDELDQWESNVTEHVQTVAATGISRLEQDILRGEQIARNLHNAKTDIFGGGHTSRWILDSRSSVATVLREANDAMESGDSDDTNLLFRFQPNESVKQSLSRLGEIKVTPQNNGTSVKQQGNFKDAVASKNYNPREKGREKSNKADAIEAIRENILLRASTLNPHAQQYLPRGKFSVRTSRDKDDCLITGSAFLPDGTLAITDQSNGKIKFFDPSFNLLSEMGFSSDPWDVCSAGGDVVAVSFPDDNLIQFFRVQNGKISGSEGNIKTPGRCYGIDIRGQRLAFICTNRDGTSVHVVDRAEDRTLGTWVKEKKPASPISRMWYLSFDDRGDILYVADEVENQIATLAVDCSHGTTLKLISMQDCGNESPYGIAASGSNIVLTSPFHNFDMRIYTQGPRSNLIKASGEAVSIDRNTDRMFISMPARGPKENRNMCQIRPCSFF